MFDVASLQSHPQSTFIAVFEDKPKYPFIALSVVTMSFAKIDVCAKSKSYLSALIWQLLKRRIYHKSI